MNKTQKRGIISLVYIGGFASLAALTVNQDHEFRKKSAVERHAYASAQGNDVYLSKRKDFLDTQVILSVGTGTGPYLIATDKEGDGTIDDYSLQATAECSGDHESKAYARNLVLTVLGESNVCEREVALLRLADRDALSRIEQELLPYSGKEGKQP